MANSMSQIFSDFSIFHTLIYKVLNLTLKIYALFEVVCMLDKSLFCMSDRNS